MTSDGIADEDWGQIHDLALAVVAESEDNEQRGRRELLDCLHRLRQRYGERPSLLATEADYTDDPLLAEALYLRAFQLASASGDKENMALTGLSLAQFYKDIVHDFARARQWLEVGRLNFVPSDDDDGWMYLDVERRLAEGEAESAKPG